MRTFRSRASRICSWRSWRSSMLRSMSFSPQLAEFEKPFQFWIVLHNCARVAAMEMVIQLEVRAQVFLHLEVPSADANVLHRRLLRGAHVAVIVNVHGYPYLETGLKRRVTATRCIPDHRHPENRTTAALRRAGKKPSALSPRVTPPRPRRIFFPQP